MKEVEQAVRQRIKYLIEHGELYPQEKPLERRLGLALLGTIAILQIIDLALKIMGS